MNLIDIVKKAQSSVPIDLPSVPSFALEPTWLASEPQESEAVTQSRPSGESKDLVSWRSVPAEDDYVRLRVEEEERLTACLNQRLQGSDALSASILDELLRSYLEGLCEKSDGARAVGKTRTKALPFTRLLKKASSLLGIKLTSAILRASVITGYWEGAQAMLDSHSVGGSTYPDLISKLVESGQVSLICQWIRNVRDPQFSDLLQALSFFLKNSQRANKLFVNVRQQWRQRALDTLAKAAGMGVEELVSWNKDGGAGTNEIQNGFPGLRRTRRKDSEDLEAKAILLAAAVDHFQPNEVCLHYLVASGQDEAVLASIFSQLDTNDVLRLLRYLEKWLKKYASHSAVLNFAARRRNLWIPSLSQIIQWVSIVLDGHYTTMILCSDFHSELQSIQLLVNGLVEISHKFAPLVGIVEHVRDNGLLPVHGSFSGDEDHVIEYLEI